MSPKRTVATWTMAVLTAATLASCADSAQSTSADILPSGGRDQTPLCISGERRANCDGGSGFDWVRAFGDDRNAIACDAATFSKTPKSCASS